MFVAVVVAVASATGAFGLSEQVSRLLAPSDSVVDAAAALPEGTVVVTARTAGLATATALDDRLVARIADVDGVVSAEGSYDQPVAFQVGWSGPVERPETLRGVVMSSELDPDRWTIVEGRAPTGPNEVALDAAGLLVADLAVGSKGRLQLPTGTRDVAVVGRVAAPGADPDAAASAADRERAVVPLSDAHVVLDPNAAPAMLDAVGRADRITVIPDSDTSPSVLRGRLDDVLPSSVQVDDVTSAAAETQQTVARIQGGVRTLTVMYVGVTVLLSVLVVLDVVGVILARRTREFGLLRLVGARRRAIVRVVLVEAMLIGLAASLLGGVLGAALVHLGAKVVRVAGVEVDVTVTPSMVVVALAVGVGVTVVGSLWPALRASRATPLDALSDTAAVADRPVRAPVPAVAFLAGFGGAAWLVSGGANGIGGWRAAGVAVCLIVGSAGLAMLSRRMVVPLAAVLGAVIGRWSVTGRLGAGNIRRHPERTATAASTLMVGLALVAVVATLGASARTAIDDQVRASGRADLYVERRGLVRVSMTSLDQMFALDPGFIDEVAAVQSFDGTVSGPGGDASSAVASALGPAARVADLAVTAGDPQDDSRGVMVSERGASKLGVGVGDQVLARSSSGVERSLPVVATYRNTALFGDVVVDRSSAEDIGADGTFELAAVDLADGVDPLWTAGVFHVLGTNFNQMYVDTPESFAALRSLVADVALRVIGVMLAGAVGVGFLGLAAALTLSSAERRRELVMLRAVGAGRRQIRAVVWIEATFIGAFAALIGMGTGLLIARVGATAVPGSIVDDRVLPWGQLAVVAAVAVVISWLVGLVVARRAARLPSSDAGRIL